MSPSNSIGSYNHDLKTTATVTSLPPEVLLKTFHILATDAEERWIRYLKDGPFPYDPTQHEVVTPVEDFHPFARFDKPKKLSQDTDPSPYVWIRLTHVCRSWRSMALSTSALWTHIAVLSEEVTIEILRRSGEQKLTVTMCLVHSEPDYSLRLNLLRRIFTQYMNRIAFAVIPASPKLFTASHAKNALQLTSLTIVEPLFQLGEINPVSDGTIVPFEFPVLRRVQMTGALCGSFTHLFSRSLRTLILRCSPYFALTYGEPAITRHKLVHALIHLPFLEILRADLDDDREDIQMTIALPMLRELQLSAPAGSLKDLLCVLNIPRSTRIQLQCVHDYENNTGTPISTALEVIARIVDNSSQVKDSKFEPIVSLAIRSHWEFFQLRGWRSTQHLLEERNDSPPDVVLEFPARIFREVDILEFLANTLFPLGNTQVLRIGRMVYKPESGAMRALLRLPTLPSLRSLTVQRVEPNIFFDIVRDTTSSQVSLVEVIFDEPDDIDTVRFSDTIEDHTDSMSTLTIHHFINVCADRGRQLESLSLKWIGNFSAKDLTMLQDVAQEVSWDSWVGMPQWL